jgi:hypothetical protein
VLEQEFWDVIDQARGAAAGNMHRLADHIRSRLTELAPADIEDCARFWCASMDAAYRWPLWDAGVVWLGWFGDDTFSRLQRLAHQSRPQNVREGHCRP